MSARHLGLGLLAVLSACTSTGPTDPADVRVDSMLVDLLADVHLADARANLGPDSTAHAARADSLRGVALRAHRRTPEQLERDLDRLAADPTLAVATYDAVATRLSQTDAPATFSPPVPDPTPPLP